MAQTENQEEPTLPTKRKLDPLAKTNEEEEEDSKPSNKTQKLQSPTNHNGNSRLTSEGKPVEEPQTEAEDNDDVDEEDDDDDYDEEENGEVVEVDRKGKGILIEDNNDDEDDGDDDSEEDDSDDDDDGGESELEEDPLAEVDLDNILPSRTRRRVVHPGGVCIRGGNDGEGNDGSDV